MPVIRIVKGADASLGVSFFNNRFYLFMLKPGNYHHIIDAATTKDLELPLQYGKPIYFHQALGQVFR